MTKHGMGLQRNLFLIQVVGTRVISLKIGNKNIEIAPIFLTLVTDLSCEHHCILHLVNPSVTGHKWACLVNRAGPSNR